MFFTLGEQECFYCGLFTWRIHLLLVRNIQQKAFAVSIPSSFQVARERVFQEIETLFADLAPVFGRVQTFPKLG